jgi:hypothetical protein
MTVRSKPQQLVQKVMGKPTGQVRLTPTAICKSINGSRKTLCKPGERVCEIIFPQQGEDLQRARSSNSRPPAEWVLLPIAVPTRSTPRRRAAGRACRFPIASAAAPQPQPSLLTPPLPGLGPFQGRLRRPRS